jgi:hypothetical protein
MRNIIGVLAALLLAGVTPCAAREKTSIYAGYSYYFPTASSTQDAFGNAWPQLTMGRLETEKPDRWAGTFDLASFRRDDSCQAMLFPLTVGVQRRIGARDTEATQPYLAVRAGPYYGKVEADRLGISETRIGLDANAAVGVVTQERYLLEGRYDHFGRIAGFDLDGFSICAGVKLLDL